MPSFSSSSAQPEAKQLAAQNANAHMLSDHEKCNIECLNQVIRHLNAVIDKLGHLLELHQGTDADDTTEQAGYGNGARHSVVHRYC